MLRFSVIYLLETSFCSPKTLLLPLRPRNFQRQTSLQDHPAIMSPWPLLLTALVVLAVGISPAEADAASRSPVLHRVGGTKYSWKVGVNFSDWSSHERFFVGDWLYFGFDKHNYSVLEVNRTGYNHCVELGFITNVTRGGRDVFNLTEPRPYFFISGHGFCSQGVKVAVHVLAGDDSSSASSAGIVPPVTVLLLPLLFLLHMFYLIRLLN